MGRSIIIGSMNIQNKYKLTNYDGLDEYGNDNAEFLKRLLIEYEVDIIGTQELVKDFIKRIKIILKPQYKIYGNFRYGNNRFLQNIPLFNRYNETVSIITKHRVLQNKTLKLPWLPHNPKDILRGIKLKSIRPRVATMLLIDIKDFGKVNFINTHLEHRLSIIQIRQLNYLQKLIQKSKYPVVLTGDFNMSMNTPSFKLFVDDLKELGYKRVPNAKMTYKYQKDKLPIDHVFVPSDWNIEEVEIAKDKYLNHFSDHYPELVKISK